MKRNSNDTLIDVSKEIATLLNESRYAFSFLYGGETLKLHERLGDYQIGIKQ